MKPSRNNRGFTLIEVLIAIAIIITLATISVKSFRTIRSRANQAASATNLRQLAVANLLYTNDHGTYCPAMSPGNRTRWHGGKKGGSSKFDPQEGFLADYFGNSRQVSVCPEFTRLITDEDSWEEGSGGYGYNAAYIGGMPGRTYTPNRPSNLKRPERTLMFATTAFSKSGGIQEYPFADPPMAQNRRGAFTTSLQPSVHFRFNGRALIAWCDGHITAERPSEDSETNYYGGDNKEANIGFFGPEQDNGYWNPDFRTANRNSSDGEL